MKELARNTKLLARPVIGSLTHSHFWEGPCRAGRFEDLQPETEALAAQKGFESACRALQGVSDEVELLEPISAVYQENFIVPKDTMAQIAQDVEKIDFFLVMSWRVPKLERFGKPLVIWQNGNEGIDVAAYCRSIGVEAYVAMNLEELNKIIHLLWVRKAVANTRALVLTQGEQPPFGMQSLIRDPALIRQRYGMEIVKAPFTAIFPYMDAVTDEEARPLAKALLAGSLDTQVNPDDFINDIKYYLAARRMMDAYDCNAFSTACHELCVSKIPQQRRFTPCVCHSLMKDAGIPSACEEDLNALLAMTILQLAANRPAFMGNPNMESEELIRIHHAVPALQMNGYGSKPLEYKLWAFTGQGFGGKLQVDFTQNEQDKVTLCRFSPDASKMSLATARVLKSEYAKHYCSPYYYLQMDSASAFMHNLADFGHHQVLVFGDYARQLKALARIMKFTIQEPEDELY